MKLVVIIPAYNEEDTIGEVVRRIPRYIEHIGSVDVVVIDDGSHDRTSEVAMQAGADFILRHKVNAGLAQSFKDGMRFAIKLGADVIVNIDADLQYDPAEIPKLVRPIIRGEADIVIGDRQVKKLKYMPLLKKIGNQLLSWIVRRLSGIPINDAQSGFRAFSRSAAAKLNVIGDYTYVQDTIIQASKKKLKVIEIPISFKPRRGRSRLIPTLWTYVKRAGITLIRSYMAYYSFKVFLFIGLGLIFIGTGFGLRVLHHFLKTGMVSPFLPSAVLSVLLIVVGSVSLIAGLIADMINQQRLLLEDVLYEILERG